LLLWSDHSPHLNRRWRSFGGNAFPSYETIALIEIRLSGSTTFCAVHVVATNDKSNKGASLKLRNIAESER
jgi:hypothetical protein